MCIRVLQITMMFNVSWPSHTPPHTTTLWQFYIVQNVSFDLIGLLNRFQLHILGYHNIDGVDMSVESIKICKEKQIYKNVIQSAVTAEPIVDIKAGKFIFKRFKKHVDLILKN